MTFGSLAVTNAVGGTIAPNTVQDPQGSLNAGPETSGIGLATTTSTSTSSTKPPVTHPVTAPGVPAR